MDRYTASNLFWLNSGAGLVLAIAFAAAGSLLARFYRNPLVANVAVALSVAIFIAAASVIHLALLKRAMRFAAASTNDVVGRAVNTAVAILLALRGWGYWALVAGIVAQAAQHDDRGLVALPMDSELATADGRERALCYDSRQRSMAGSARTIPRGTSTICWLAGNSMRRPLDSTRKAYDLFALSASQLTAPLHNVALAALSRLNQDPARFRRYLANSLGIIAFVGMAVSADLTLVGKDVVRLVLGPKWSESGRIFELFGPGIGVMLLYSTVGWIHLSIGKPGRWLRWTLVERLRHGFCCFFWHCRGDQQGIAAAWSVSFWILLIPAFWYAGRPIGFGVSSLIAAVWRYAAASLLAGLATAAIFRGTPISASPAGAGAALEAIIIISAAFVTLYLGAVILLHWGCAPLRQLASLLRELAPTRRATRPVAEPVGECK